MRSRPLWCWAGEAQRLASRPGPEVSSRWAALGGKAAIRGHQVHAGDRLQRAQQHAACVALGFAADVHAEVSAVDGVDIGVPGRAEENLVARSGSAMRVGGRVGRVVVRAQVGLDFDDAPGDQAGRGSDGPAACRAGAEQPAPAEPQRSAAAAARQLRQACAWARPWRAVRLFPRRFALFVLLCSIP